MNILYALRIRDCNQKLAKWSSWRGWQTIMYKILLYNSGFMTCLSVTKDRKYFPNNKIKYSIELYT